MEKNLSVSLSDYSDSAISKGFINNDLEKSKSGVYKNTAENRKEGKVGQSYGSKTDKKDEPIDLQYKMIKMNAQKVDKDKNGNEFVISKKGNLFVNGKMVTINNDTGVIQIEGKDKKLHGRSYSTYMASLLSKLKEKNIEEAMKEVGEEKDPYNNLRPRRLLFSQIKQFINIS